MLSKLTRECEELNYSLSFRITIISIYENLLFFGRIQDMKTARYMRDMRFFAKIAFFCAKRFERWMERSELN